MEKTIIYLVEFRYLVRKTKRVSVWSDWSVLSAHRNLSVAESHRDALRIQAEKQGNSDVDYMVRFIYLDD